MTTHAPHTLALAAAIAALGSTVAAQAAGASTDPAPGARPHSRVVTYDRGDIRVQRLQMAITRSNGLLHAQVHLDIANEGAVAATRRLRIGRCTGGSTPAPSCPSTASVVIRLAPGQSRDLTKTVTLRQPPAGIDSVEASLTKIAVPAPYLYHSDAELLLKGRAWRGAGAGRLYGVRFASGDAARRLNFDVPAVSPTSAYIDVKWQGTAAPEQAKTTISRCQGATCVGGVLAADRRRSGTDLFGNRFDFDRGGADSLGLRADTSAGAQLFQAALPWPA